MAIGSNSNQRGKRRRPASTSCGLKEEIRDGFSIVSISCGMVISLRRILECVFRPRPWRARALLLHIECVQASNVVFIRVRHRFLCAEHFEVVGYAVAVTILGLRERAVG